MPFNLWRGNDVLKSDMTGILMEWLIIDVDTGRNIEITLENTKKIQWRLYVSDLRKKGLQCILSLVEEVICGKANYAGITVSLLMQTLAGIEKWY